MVSIVRNGCLLSHSVNIVNWLCIFSELPALQTQSPLPSTSKRCVCLASLITASLKYLSLARKASACLIHFRPNPEVKHLHMQVPLDVISGTGQEPCIFAPKEAIRNVLTPSLVEIDEELADSQTLLLSSSPPLPRLKP
ncbi:uncharacterized protein TrAtP1_001572 [Trichoderma atroviride]|uniref:uncharacterized protein n=1 Tax=Hypocrea atroviridis TaxID=63577 RepID=UPI003327A46E|nr:hypothetical protein TrAtP1_001572 [Trichoderma atroviride]